MTLTPMGRQSPSRGLPLIPCPSPRGTLCGKARALSRLHAKGPSKRGLAVCETNLADLLHQVILDAHLLDLVELRLEPINVILFVLEDGFKQLAGSVVADFNG